MGVRVGDTVPVKLLVEVSVEDSVGVGDEVGVEDDDGEGVGLHVAVVVGVAV